MEIFEFIKKSPLFGGAEDLYVGLHAKQEVFEKGARILAAGDFCRCVGAMLEGGADVIREDANGDPVTVAHIGEGEMFAEAFAFAGVPLSVSVQASQRCAVLWLDAQSLLAEPRLAANALKIFARKNVFLTERIEHLSRRTLEAKVLSYLKSARRTAGTETFRVPFDRQGLADYLGCDRSALSAVLSKLKKKGVLDFHKNAFRIL